MKIQEDSLIPKYHQIKSFLLDYIRDNHLVEGDPLPSESSLMKEYQVSRNTIRLAFELLVKEGLAEKQQGKGTFFRDPRFRNAQTTQMIGLLAPFSNPFIQKAIVQLEELFYQRGYTMLIGNSSDQARREKILLERFAERKIEGLLILPVSQNPEKLLQSLSIPSLLMEDPQEKNQGDTYYASLAEEIISLIESDR